MAAVRAPEMTVEPRHHRVLFTSGVLALLAFVALSVVAHRVPYFSADLSITRTIQSIHAPLWEAPLGVMNFVGFPPVVDIVYGLVILIIFLAGRRTESFALLFASLGGAGLNNLAKLIVGRPRPPAGLVVVEHHIKNGAYPAGHVLNFTAFGGLLCYLVARSRWPHPARIALIAVLLILLALMGIARVHAGEHWPSDVLGGYLLGLAWLAVTIPFYEWRLRSAQRRGHPHAPALGG